MLHCNALAWVYILIYSLQHKWKKQNILSKQSRYSARSFVYLKRQLSPKQTEKIQSLNIKGLYFKPEYKRFYPDGEVGAHLLGLTNIDDFGQSGLELAFDEYLRGEKGKKRILDARN